MKFTHQQAYQKAQELVEKMTIEEKVLQLGVAAPEIERLDIPEYHYWNESLHGVARAGVATMFPQAIGLAAMFDKTAMQKIGEVIATEARAKYNMAVEYDDRDIYKGLTFWSPNINIFRDPRWGRGQETYGEDPHLTAELGKRFISGLQGDEDYMKVASCVKHFAVHSGPESGRADFNAVVDEKDLNETYLPAFEECVREADAEILMTAYNAINGVPASANKSLLDKVRKEWGFNGHVTSDCLALEQLTLNHKFSASHAEGLAAAFSSGVDLNCGIVIKSLFEALEKELISEEIITQACTRLFATRYKLGMFAEDCEFDQIPYEVVACQEHQRLAYEAALKSFVLLKNDQYLPLNKSSLKNVAVIGPNANNRKALEGNYHGTAERYTTVLEGIQDALGTQARVYYSEGCNLTKDKVEPLAKADDRLSETLKIASMSDVIFMCLGIDSTLEGEEGDAGNAYAAGDKKDLNLPGRQQFLLEKVLDTGKPVVLILGTGSALTLNGLEKRPNLKAIMTMWYPGSQGGKAIADTLFGKVSPSGKLPITFYHTAETLPDFEDYAMKGRTYRYLEEEALYPFGFGLTYSNVHLSNETKLRDDLISVDIQNIGEHDITEVVQVYVRHTTSPLEVKNHRLCCFERVSLKSGEKKTVQLNLAKHAYTLVNESGQRIAESGKYEVSISVSQPDDRSITLSNVSPLKIMIDRP